MDEGDTLANALVGGAVTFFTGNFVPFAPVLGGAIAAYLEGGSRRDGVRVGAYSGFIAYVPLLALTVVVSSVLGVVGFGIGFLNRGGVGLGIAGFLGAIVFLLILVVSFLYFVGGGALGGWLGNYLKHDSDLDL
ncbi:DUF5518 domain-containing protein [Salinarchaeum laminariae]|uniref:DUF5518 domain-containing protein n=1 Tax=Salinarchaeum laminariae TaxID=869888 RepID=UPI0020BD6942|nr:DUF5518 domain-containing protein [Salinarchaeum laminariae]